MKEPQDVSELIPIMSNESAWKDVVFILKERWWIAGKVIKGQKKLHALSMLEREKNNGSSASGRKEEIEQ